MKKVSIVLPTYNGERYLVQAIQSVLTQTYEDWELIIVDDCSTDRTAEIIQDYAEKDARIRVIRNVRNQKLPQSLNIGFRHSQGEYLTWTSDDNVYEKTAIEVMVEALDSHPDYGFVYCDMDCVYEDGIRMNHIQMDIRRLYVEDVIGACFLYRRQVLQTVGEYDPNMALVEDYDYWLRVDQKYKILHIPECLYQYRFHNGSLTMTREREIASQRHRMRLRHLDYLLERVDEREKEVLFLDMWMHSSKDTWQRREQFFRGGILPERLKWLDQIVENGNTAAVEKNLVLFGAGDYGRKALAFFGKDRVSCFVDNDKSRAGTLMDGVPVISFEKLAENPSPCQIVLCVGSRFLLEIAAQLERAGMTKYILFMELWLREGR